MDEKYIPGEMPELVFEVDDNYLLYLRDSSMYFDGAFTYYFTLNTCFKQDLTNKNRLTMLNIDSLRRDVKEEYRKVLEYQLKQLI